MPKWPTREVLAATLEGKIARLLKPSKMMVSPKGNTASLNKV